MSRGSSQNPEAEDYLRNYQQCIIKWTLEQAGVRVVEHPKYRQDNCPFCKAGIPYRMGEEKHNTPDANECLAPDPEAYIVILEEKIEALRKSSMADILAESVKTIKQQEGELIKTHTRLREVMHESANRWDQLRELSNSSRSFYLCLNRIRDLIKKEIGDESANQD